MADMLNVKPVKGATLPLERAGLPKRRTVDRPMAVPNTLYYRRALRRGDLAKATATEVKGGKPEAAADTKKGSESR